MLAPATPEPSAGLATLPHAWQEIGALHALAYQDVLLLMSCREAHLTENWQAVIVRCKLEEACASGAFASVEELLCFLIRAHVEPHVDLGGLGAVVMEMALRDEARVRPEEAGCVRLSRVLAVKLDHQLCVQGERL
jgi:hypothetical protein